MSDPRTNLAPNETWEAHYGPAQLYAYIDRLEAERAELMALLEWWTVDLHELSLGRARELQVEAKTLLTRLRTEQGE